MARGTYLGEDISIFLSEEEVLHLGQLNLDWNAQNGKKLNRIPLEIILDVSEGQQLTARIQVEDFDDLGDGIRVDRQEYGFLIQVNDKAYWNIKDNPLSGTRYDGSNKIHFYREDKNS